MAEIKELHATWRINKTSDGEKGGEKTMDDVTEGFISVNGGNVWYRITGNGRGTPLLLLHGGPGGKSSDRDPLRSLGQERPIIQYDQLGCGNSGHPRNTELWTVERYVEELEQVRKALELEEVHILGHS